MEQSLNGSCLLRVAASGAQEVSSILLLDLDPVPHFPRSILSPSSSENT